MAYVSGRHGTEEMSIFEKLDYAETNRLPVKIELESGFIYDRVEIVFSNTNEVAVTGDPGLMERAINSEDGYGGSIYYGDIKNVEILD